MSINNHILFPELLKVIKSLNFNTIDQDRKLILQALIDYIQQKTNAQKEIRLNFICTHNSRRSHLSQIWAQTAADYFKIESVNCYSGGTEATALFPMIAETLKRSGFKIKILSEGKNPIYSIKNSKNSRSIIGFSKKYDDHFNPTSEFAAILTCSQADKDCPFITGAEKRIPIPFEDPKQFDNNSLQKEKYQERSLQIATELFYVFSKIK